MNGFIVKNWFKAAVTIILLAIIASFAYKLYAQNQPKDNHLSPMKQGPEFQLSNLEGAPVSSNDFKGKVQLVYFFYTNCPDVCLPSTYMLSKVQEGLKAKGVFGTKSDIISITMDPARDTPKVLKEFGDSYNSDASGWHFLRGDEAKTRDLAEKYGIIIVKDKEGNYTHSNYVLLVDKKGVLRTYYDVADPNLKQESIVNDVMTLIKEK
jgi:protein SCO1